MGERLPFFAAVVQRPPDGQHLLARRDRLSIAGDGGTLAGEAVQQLRPRRGGPRLQKAQGPRVLRRRFTVRADGGGTPRGFRCVAEHSLRIPRRLRVVRQSRRIRAQPQAQLVKLVKRPPGQRQRTARRDRPKNRLPSMCEAEGECVVRDLKHGGVRVLRGASGHGEL